MKNVFLAIFLVTACFVQGQQVSIIPQPASVKEQNGRFRLSAKTLIVLRDKADRPSADFLNDYLQQFYGFRLKIAPAAKTNFIRFTTPTFIKAPDNEERYTLNVTNGAIEVQGDSHRGTFNGMLTLLQLLPVETRSKSMSFVSIPAVSIEDQPRFRYRGIHLDVCRHFFPVKFIKKYIDYLALHKFNNFHWHLTDDQGWRIEIKKHPKLTTVGGRRNGTIIGRYPGKGNDSIRYGGFYTQDEVKEVVRYAASRFINVIPEIEMPGHASAAIAAYPELSCFPTEDTKVAKGTAWAGPTKGKQVQQAWGVFDDIFCAGKDNTFRFLEGVLDEVIPLFPSRYIHIGGDEAPKTHWKRCPNCQQRMKAQGLKDEHQLQSYFIQRIEKYVNGKGKQIIGWDEILEGGLAPNATVMSWQGEKGGIEAAQQDHDVIMTPGNWCYFDHAQSRNEDSVTIGGYTPIEEVYSYEPVPKQLDQAKARHILGAQANLWTEYIKNTRKVEYQLFPRIAAMSEVLWTAKEKKDSADFEKRLLQQFKRYDRWQVNYSPEFFAIRPEIVPADNFNGLQLKLSSRSGQDFRMYKVAENSVTDILGRQQLSMDTFDLGPYEGPLQVTGSGEYFIHYDAGAKPRLYRQAFQFNKTTGKKITTNHPPSPTYPGNGGSFGLVNGIKAQQFNSTEWLGWNGKTVEITIDLGKPEMVHEVALNVWKQEPSWIYLPQKVEIVFSYKDEKGADQSTSMEFEQPEEGWGEDRRLQFTFEPKMVNAITIRLTPVMSIPQGRQGAGKPAWVFVDEVEVN